jgi:FkbM family methyltransferase
MSISSLRCHHFWTDSLNRQSVVIDAGAHQGEFSAELARRFGCQCHLIEANPVLAGKLVAAPNGSVTQGALGPQDGRAVFELDANMEASRLSTAAQAIGATVEVDVFSLPTLMTRVGATELALLKLDVEGAEFEILATTPVEVLRRIAQITVEFHDFMPQFAGRGLFESARARLAACGFICCPMSLRTHGDVFFLNRALIPLTSWQSFYVQHLARYVSKARSLCP